MPLNITDDEEKQYNESPKPQPILRGPAPEPKSNKKLLLVVFALVVIGAAVFLVYLFTTMRPRKETAQQPSAIRQGDTVAAVVPRSDATPLPATPAAEAPAASPVPHGLYTIFVASYIDRTPAVEEVGRWKDAGYEASVVEALGHFRVAVGDYAAFREARTSAAALSEGFENGFWIGKR
jgi:hypothetical protein